MLRVAKPNGGKTTFSFNVLFRIALQRHTFRKTLVIERDPAEVKGYDHVEHEYCDNIHDPIDFSSKMKMLCIFQDLYYLSMFKAQRPRLERLLGYCSAH